MTDKKEFTKLTPEELKEVKIEFVPGCFDNFDGTQEELDQLIQEIQAKFADGSIQNEALEITAENFDELPEEVQLQLARFLMDPEDQHLIPGPDRKLQ